MTCRRIKQNNVSSIILCYFERQNYVHIGTYFLSINYNIITSCVSLLTLIVTLSQKSWSCGIGSNVALPEQCWGWPCVRPVPRFAPGPQPSSSWVLSFGSDLNNVYRKLIYDEITRFLLFINIPGSATFFMYRGQKNKYTFFMCHNLNVPFFISNKHDVQSYKI